MPRWPLYTPSYSIVSTISRETCNLISSVLLPTYFLQCPEKLATPLLFLLLADKLPSTLGVCTEKDRSGMMCKSPLEALIYHHQHPTLEVPPGHGQLNRINPLRFAGHTSALDCTSPTENHRSKALIYLPLAPNLKVSPIRLT